MTYLVHTSRSHVDDQWTLVDRGANGGVAGDDVRVIDTSTKTVSVRGLGGHQVDQLPIGTVGAVIDTQRGKVICIMHQYALMGKGKTIHASAQWEHFGSDVNEKSRRIPGGTQCVTTLDGYAIPLSVKNGLPYMKMRPYTDSEWDSLPHVVVTSDTEWDPSVIDFDLTNDEEWFDAVSNDSQLKLNNGLCDEYGDFNRTSNLDNHTWHFFDAMESHEKDPDLETTVDMCIRDALIHNIQPFVVNNGERKRTKPITVTSQQPDYEQLRPHFGWLPTDIVKRTFAKTTQYARMPHGTVM